MDLILILYIFFFYCYFRASQQHDKCGQQLKAVYRKFESDDEFFREFERECQLVRGGLEVLSLLALLALLVQTYK